MDNSVITVLAVVGALSLLGAALMHALVAALEHLPYAVERQIAARKRITGKPTAAAKLAASTQHTDNAASVAYAILEAVGIVSWSFIAWQIGVTGRWDWWTTGLFAAAVAAFLSLMLVRAIPRQLGRSHPLGTVSLVSPYTALMITLTTPVRLVVPALRIPALSEAEDLVEQAQDALEDDDAELLRSVVNLGDTLTREVMVPRTDMVTMQTGTLVREAMQLFMTSGFSRVPVIGEGIDDITGVLYLKDMVKATWEHPDKLDEHVDQYVREPVFLPESVPVDDLLRRMQLEVFHMAVVVDEYGGVAGLVTIEDALEEIVGEVVDEHDSQRPEAEPLPGGGFRVPARLPLDELGELFDIEIEEDDVDTVAGLLTKALGRVPIMGSRAEAHGLELMAERAEGRRRRITTIVVTMTETADDN